MLHQESWPVRCTDLPCTSSVENENISGSFMAHMPLNHVYLQLIYLSSGKDIISWEITGGMGGNL